MLLDNQTGMAVEDIKYLFFIGDKNDFPLGNQLNLFHIIILKFNVIFKIEVDT